jgi:hypothetical protein
MKIGHGPSHVSRAVLGGFNMKSTVPQLERNSAATVDPPEEILSAKEVAQDIEASRSWVYVHADELGRLPRRQAHLVPMAAHPGRELKRKNQGEHKDSRSANKGCKSAVAGSRPPPRLPTRTRQGGLLSLEPFPFSHSPCPFPFPLQHIQLNRVTQRKSDARKNV